MTDQRQLHLLQRRKLKMGIKFGTDGWRAIVGKDFNEENVKTVTKAIGKYVFDN